MAANQNLKSNNHKANLSIPNFSQTMPELNHHRSNSNVFFNVNVPISELKKIGEDELIEELYCT